VFTVVNIALLVLRKEKVEHSHFRAPSWTPVVGAVLCAYLAIPWLSGRPASDYWVALILVGVGVVLWLINWAVMRARGERVKELDPQALND
jgi:amino acid transporter